MNILLIGDIVGRPGRELVQRGLRALIDHHGLDLVIANVENSAAGFGVTKDIGDTLLEAGIDVMTSGNHIWDKKEVLEYIAAQYLGATDTLRLVARAIDGDAGAVLRYSLLPPTPASVAIDSVSGLIVWSPSSAERQVSQHIVVAATDGVLADTQAFDVFFLSTEKPVFGRELPALKVLPDPWADKAHPERRAPQVQS